MATSGRLDADGLLLDMDGVLTVSWEPLPGAVEAVWRLHEAGLPLRVLTGTTALGRARLGEHLRALEFPFADDEVLAAALIAAEFLRAHRPGARVAHIGDAQAEDLAGIDLVGLDEAPDIVLLSGADESFRFETFNEVLRALLDGAELVAMHGNLVWATHDGPCLDTGAHLPGLEKAAGCRAVVTGKPAPECFAAGAASLGLPPERVAMVGDDLEGDALAAEVAGMTGVLVRTGKYREETMVRATARPSFVVGSIAEVPGLLGL